MVLKVVAVAFVLGIISFCCLSLNGWEIDDEDVDYGEDEDADGE